MPLVVGLIVIGGLGWLAWNYLNSTGEEGRDFANEAAQRLLYKHDAAFLETGLSPRVRPNYPLLQRQAIMDTLTRLGVPTKPVKLEGSIGMTSHQGTKEPQGRFSSNVSYHSGDARLNLSVVRHSGRWWIDMIGFEYKSKSTPTPSPTPEASATPTPFPSVPIEP